MTLGNAEDSRLVGQWEKVLQTYSGELSKMQVAAVAMAARETLLLGRYTAKDCSEAVHLVDIVQKPDARRADDVLVTFVSLRGGEKAQVTVAKFIDSYKFFAPDCA